VLGEPGSRSDLREAEVEQDDAALVEAAFRVAARRSSDEEVRWLDVAMDALLVKDMERTQDLRRDE
jgi:hypothetical protein